MKFCVIKDTTKVIDGSENTVEIMIQNAINAGFTGNEVEILTEEEYQVRKSLEPIAPQEPTEIDLLKEENSQLKTRLQATEQITSETSSAQQELLELLIDMGVI